MKKTGLILFYCNKLIGVLIAALKRRYLIALTNTIFRRTKGILSIKVFF